MPSSPYIRNLVLDTPGYFTRRDLFNRLDRSWRTIKTVVRELEDDGLVIQIGEKHTGGGRAHKVFRVKKNPQRASQSGILP